jgi:hypothetical protein
MPEAADGRRGWLLVVPFHGRPLPLAFGITRGEAWDRAAAAWQATESGAARRAAVGRLRHLGAKCVRAFAAPQADWDALLAVAHDAREESSMYARGLAEGRAAEREECCRAVCPHCAGGVPLCEHPGGGGWSHDRADGVRVGRCLADAIRRRAEEDGR